MNYQNTNNPLNEHLNSNENDNQMNHKKKINPNDFIIEEEHKPFDNKNNYNNNDIFIVSFKCSYHIIKYSFIIIILILSCIPMLISPDNLYLTIPIFSIGFIANLLIAYYSYRKIEIIKDISSNKINIKLINYLCLTRLKIKCNLENIHFRAKKEITHNTDGKSHETTELIIVNDYKNIEDIDLENTDIKKKPARFYYSINEISMENNCNYQDLTTALNLFIGAPNSIDFYQYTDNQCTKISDNFYAFFLREPISCTVFKWILFAIGILMDIFIIYYSIKYSTDKNKIHYKD